MNWKLQKLARVDRDRPGHCRDRMIYLLFIYVFEKSEKQKDMIKENFIIKMMCYYKSCVNQFQLFLMLLNNICSIIENKNYNMYIEKEKQQ